MKCFYEHWFGKKFRSIVIPTVTVIPAQAGIHFYNKSKASDFRVKQGMSPLSPTLSRLRERGKQRPHTHGLFLTLNPLASKVLTHIAGFDLDLKSPAAAPVMI
jgi:hypothetical protein